MNYSEKIAADKTSLGFEYQDLVYIEKLIELSPAQVLGLELHDDIHIQTTADDGIVADLMLIQVKHSVHEGNITDRDIDLWKTLHNWLNLIPGLPVSRKHTFQLYTNKGLNSQHFVTLLKTPYLNVQDIIDHIRATDQDISVSEALKKPGDSPNPLAKYVKAVSQASDDQLKFLFERFEFHSDSSSILNKISSALRRLSIPQSQLEDARKHVIGAFKESKFSRIKKGEKVLITFDDFRTTMGFDRIIISARSDRVDFDRFLDIYYSYQRPDSLSFSSSKFCEQLKDIGISDEEIVDRGIEMMLAEDFMTSLQNIGSFSASDNARLENKAFSEWQQLHRNSHRSTNIEDPTGHNQASLDCYNKTMESPLKAGDVELPKNLSCGKYAKLSNVPRIGWRKNWQSTFKK